MGFAHSLLRLGILTLTAYGAYWLVVEKYKVVEIDWNSLKADAQHSFFTIMYASSPAHGWRDYVPTWLSNMILDQTIYAECLRYRLRRPQCWQTEKLRITQYSVPLDANLFAVHYLNPSEPFRVFSIDDYLSEVVSPDRLLKTLPFFKKAASEPDSSDVTSTSPSPNLPPLFWYKLARCSAQTPDEYRLLDVKSFGQLLETGGQSTPSKDAQAGAAVREEAAANWNVKWRIPSATMTRRARAAFLGNDSVLVDDPRFLNKLPNGAQVRYGDEYLMVDSAAMSHYIIPNSFAYYSFEPRTVFQLETELRQRHQHQQVPDGSEADGSKQDSKPSLSSTTVRKLLDSSCINDNHVTVYEQLYGCRHVVLYPVTSCTSNADGTNINDGGMYGGAPQPFTVTLMPRHVLYFNASYFNAWSYPFERPCSNMSLSISHIRTLRIGV